MVSRRKILSQSRDELNFRSHEDEEDTWYNKDKLFKVFSIMFVNEEQSCNKDSTKILVLQRI